jgi:hypothetical protein
LPGRWPLLDQVAVDGVEQIEVWRRLDLDSDPYLREHELLETPTLPFTVACELLAETAEALCPGLVISELSDVLVTTPIKVHGGSIDLRITGSRRDDGGIDLRVHSDLVLKGRVLARDRLHVSGVARLEAQPPPGESAPPASETGFLHAHSYFHGLSGPVRLGPMFDRAAWVHVGATGSAGTVRPGRERHLIARTSRPLFRCDPFALDGALQVAASWDGYANGQVSVPVGAARIRIGCRRAVSEPLRVESQVVSIKDDEVVYDITAATETGSVSFAVEGLRQRRVGPGVQA